MLLSTLLACTCTSFDDMDVVDATRDGASADFLGEISRAIDDFASWTGRDGVCVPGVRVVDHVDMMVPEFTGKYQGAHEPIRIDPESEHPYTSIVHELSHGLDHREDISR